MSTIWRRTKLSIEEILKLVEKNYKYTQLTDDFLYNVFVGVGIQPKNKELKYCVECPPEVNYKAMIRVNDSFHILQNDFELTDMDGHPDIEFSQLWQEGMIKALPLYDKVNNIDAHHYLADLRVYEFDKMANRVNSLCDMLAIREAEEQN